MCVLPTLRDDYHFYYETFNRYVYVNTECVARVQQVQLLFFYYTFFYILTGPSKKMRKFKITLTDVKKYIYIHFLLKTDSMFYSINSLKFKNIKS